MYAAYRKDHHVKTRAAGPVKEGNRTPEAIWNPSQVKDDSENHWRPEKVLAYPTTDHGQRLNKPSLLSFPKPQPLGRTALPRAHNEENFIEAHPIPSEGRSPNFNTVSPSDGDVPSSAFLWLGLRMVHRYWWLILVFAIVWPRTRLRGLELSVSYSPAEGAILRSLTNLATSFENNSCIRPVQQKMQDAEYNVLFLQEHTRRSGLSYVSAAQVGQLSREYRLKSNTVVDDFENLLMLHGIGSIKMVSIVDMVIRWLEENKRKIYSRSLAVSFVQSAIGYDGGSRDGILRAYGYMIPEAIDIFQSILDPIRQVLPKITEFMEIVVAMQAQIRGDTTDETQKHREFQHSILALMGAVFGAKSRCCQMQLELLDNIAAMISILMDRLNSTQKLLNEAKKEFETMQSTYKIEAPTEFTEGSSTTGVVRELKAGSRALKDALERVKIADENYIWSVQTSRARY
ncbi:hypothetical protein MMC17_009397 [Xylographa soralifera]|nr:hypothetical protein [Xylographa soralifera]